MSDSEPSIADLETAARKIRVLVLESVAHAGAGHIGGPLSAADILAALYFRVLRVDPERPEWEDRDRFVLSKGHSAIGLYSALALRGFFPVGELKTFDAIDSRLQGHPDMKALPGLDMSSGSLGLGFSAAVGMALGAALTGRDFTTFALLGDGECNEGIVWEGAHVASRYRLGNLVAIVDQNGLQQFGWRGAAPGLRARPYEAGELADRWSAFGWRTVEIDGHDMNQVVGALEGARDTGDRPVVVIADTIKGRGVSFMEDSYPWHSQVPDAEQLGEALTELGMPEGVLERSGR